ncbi:hypothetical protein IMSAGC008_01667 [Muribaculaceae bacterium]|nr:hypothetical protein IMSAGC008_01667 [Muribaculaceae bacterium]
MRTEISQLKDLGRMPNESINDTEDIIEEMFTALDGIALDVPSWEDVIPEDLQPAMDRLADLVDE